MEHHREKFVMLIENLYEVLQTFLIVFVVRFALQSMAVIAY